MSLGWVNAVFGLPSALMALRTLRALRSLVALPETDAPALRAARRGRRAQFRPPLPTSPFVGEEDLVVLPKHRKVFTNYSLLITNYFFLPLGIFFNTCAKGTPKFSIFNFQFSQMRVSERKGCLQTLPSESILDKTTFCQFPSTGWWTTSMPLRLSSSTPSVLW